MSRIYDFELGRRSKTLIEETKPKLNTMIWNVAKEIEKAHTKIIATQIKYYFT
jgi:hypothetical protein